LKQFRHILYDQEPGLQEPGLARLTLNRPPLNILNLEMIGEVQEALDSFRSRTDLRLVVLSATGRAFCAGVAVEEHTAELVHQTLPAFHRLFFTLAELKAPIMAVVNGPALGGGCELVAACDLVIAAERATFGQPEIKVGVFPPVAAVLFPQIMGRTRALELILGGGTIDASTAREWGLLSRVVPDERLEEEAERWVAQLLELSGPVLQMAKGVVYAASNRTFGDPASTLRAIEDLYLTQLMALEDPHEGLRAFMEKRSPQWKHR
jgi:cyclohexa-1,5-dienecarbonyl-CoA hydratase